MTQSNNQALTPSKKWTANLAALLGSLLFLAFLFLAAEGIARLYGISKVGRENFDYHWRRLAKSAGVYSPEPGIINQLGFHSREIPVKKSKNAFRILVLGGSAVYGTREINSSWTWYLEKSLQKKYPDKDIQVLNGGISGGRTMEEFRLLRRAISLKPDIVISFDGWNDVYNAHYCPEPYKNEAAAVLDLSKAKLRAKKWERYLENHSYLFLIATKNFYAFRKNLRRKDDPLAASISPEKGAVKPEEPQALTGDPGAFEKTARTLDKDGMTRIRCIEEVSYQLRPTGKIPDDFSVIYKKGLRAIHTLASENHIPHIAILQPSLAYTIMKNQAPPEAEAVLRKGSGIFYEDWLNASAQLYPAAQKVMQELRNEGLLTYDFSLLLSGPKALYYSDAVHYREDPEVLSSIASSVENVLAENRLLP